MPAWERSNSVPRGIALKAECAFHACRGCPAVRWKRHVDRANCAPPSKSYRAPMTSAAPPHARPAGYKLVPLTVNAEC
eukprot:6173654-Pleurochrysis_carterae.AAC.1